MRILLVSLLLLALLPARGLYANGWEHGAVPFEVLLRSLDDENVETRRRAAESLGIRGQREAVEPLLTRLKLSERNVQVRGALIVALGRLADPRATPALTACLQEEPREELRGDCALALGMGGDPAALQALLDALSDDSILVRSRAVDALGSYNAPRAVSALVRLLRGGSASRLRAIRALGRGGAGDAVDPLLEALAEARGEAETLALVDALATLAAHQAREPLTRLLEIADEPAVRVRIVVALGAIRDGDALPTLVTLLHDENAAVRFFAVDSLRALGKPAAVGPLNALGETLAATLAGEEPSALLEDPVQVLGDLSLLEAVLRGVTELDAAAGLSALLAAAKLDFDQRASSAALKLADGFYRVRRAALYGLGYTDADDAFALLSDPSVMGDPDARLRSVVVRSLGVLGHPLTVDLLLPTLRDESPEVRWMTASVLGLLNDPAAAPALRARLADDFAEVRRQSALALAHLGQTEARPELLRLADEDENARVRDAARAAARLLDSH